MEMGSEIFGNLQTPKIKKAPPDIHPRNKCTKISAKSNHFWAL